MCLLDAVIAYDALHLTARAALRLASHPLLWEGQLASSVVIEYAAQAMAVHGSLQDSTQGARQGMLASVREVQFYTGYLVDGLALDIQIEQLFAEPQGLLYRFRIAYLAGDLIATGRAMVALG
jgi:predicted hotdog family 3-hydroxylacyl-ACP dehydratase